jgi:hypothetical protein
VSRKPTNFAIAIPRLAKNATMTTDRLPSRIRGVYDHKEGRLVDRFIQEVELRCLADQLGAIGATWPRPFRRSVRSRSPRRSRSRSMRGTADHWRDLATKSWPEFGRRVDETFYPGLAAMLDDLKSLASATRDVHVEFYIISGGLKELLGGSQLVKDRFSGVYASQLGEDPDTGGLTRLKRVVTFTEKTRYLFEINKGIEPADSLANPYLVNREVKQEDRRVPSENMVYVGDGLTDILCRAAHGLGRRRPDNRRQVSSWYPRPCQGLGPGYSCG